MQQDRVGPFTIEMGARFLTAAVSAMSCDVVGEWWGRKQASKTRQPSAVTLRCPTTSGAYGDWSFRKEKQGVMIYSKEAAAGDASGGTARCFLGKGRIGLPARLVFDFLCDDEVRRP